MEQQKQIQIQFRLVDVQELQFVNLSKQWPEGELQVNNQLQFNCDTEKRIVRCVTNFEYKKNDITQLILGVQTVFEFAREGWSAMYDLNARRIGSAHCRHDHWCRTRHLGHSQRRSWNSQADTAPYQPWTDSAKQHQF